MTTEQDAKTYIKASAFIGLFGALFATGCSLVNNYSVKETIGAAMMGFVALFLLGAAGIESSSNKDK